MSAAALALEARRASATPLVDPEPATLPAPLQAGDSWVRLVAGEHGLALSAGRGDAEWLRADPLVTVRDAAGAHALAAREATNDGSRLTLRGGDAAWDLAGSVTFEADLGGLARLDLELEYLGRPRAPRGAAGAEATPMAAQVRCDLPEASVSSWMIPGAFYHQGPAPGYRGHPYPRFDPAGGDPDLLVSNSWAFSADRASHPAVLGWTERTCVGLATRAAFGDDVAGLEFGAGGGRAWLALNFPWKEAPRGYVFTRSGWRPARQATRTVQRGERVGMTCWLYLGDAEAQAYDPLLRWLYAWQAPEAALRPWFGKETAAGLAASGIMRWHANPVERLLYETAWFADQPGRRRVDRAQQHVAWISGVPTALALARYGRASGQALAEQVGLGVIDRIAREAPRPFGLFWADWMEGQGWGAGWSREPGWIQARTAAEATLYLLRAAAEEAALGRPRPVWLQAARGSLDFAVRAQRADGNFGAHYHAHDGSVVEWSGAAGLLWVAALVEGWRATGEARYLEAARQGGAYYAAQVEATTLHGAPEDADLTPTSEDGYNALLAYSALAQADGDDPRWLALARQAANWTMSFRFAYNVPFRASTPLGALGFATRGGDIASPRNSHLHPYGLICLRELLDLWEVTGDHYYLERGRDHLLCFWQTIARFDGDFGAGRGMMTEQWYHADWVDAKGHMLPLSHVWCLGMVLHGWWTVRDFGDLALDGRTWRATLLAPGSVDGPHAGPAGLTLSVTNPLGEPLPLRARLVELEPQSALVDGVPVALERAGGRTYVSFTVPPRQTVRLDLELPGT